MPTSYKMWVSIPVIPGGLAFTWDDWTTLPTGAKIATNHASKVLGIDITNLKAATDLTSFGLSTDPFQPIL